MSNRTHQITTESLLSLRLSERLALEMITAVLRPLDTDERIGLLLTTLADNVADVAQTDEEIDVLVERLRYRFRITLARRLPPTTAADDAEWQRQLADRRSLTGCGTRR
jgi:hypothetical protein